ncbi:terminase gpA endonuclease subunit [uncultured Martelella sp.]|uniref:terminase gpA endonuclease subunit n=1 Tax=uncultured Martelella sp. TaxID=392331 RepID=UPI0029C68550|nr:terminase gpA endonuclease subunit [uncultured Martelella sp.]
MNAHPGALRLVMSSLAETIRPVPPVPFQEWIGKNIVLVDGNRKGEFWSADDAPYLSEIAECLSQEHPCNLVTVRKGQQTGVSILAMSWMLYIAEMCPDNALYVAPGIDLLQDLNSGKFNPLIEAWQEKTEKDVVDLANSSTYTKKIGSDTFIYLGNANTKKDLSGKTCRYGVKDELSKWEYFIDGSDPETLFFGRFTAFRRLRNYKILELSTPELDSGDPLGDGPGHCRIDRSFRRSDQRFWHIKCPECGAEQVQKDKNLIVDRDHPHKSRMRCTSCTHEISEMERVIAVKEGRFIPSETGPDRHPGFHVDAFMSLMMSYEAIAEDRLSSEGKGETGAKDYHNLVLALPYQMKGNAPDHVRLMERSENYPPETIPPGGLLLAGGADVQGHGIYLEIVAFGQDRQSWCVAAEYFPGATDNPGEGAWPALAAFVSKEFPDAQGVLRTIDALAVDAGYNTNAVLEWCRRHPNTYAVKGEPGRNRPAISQPKRQSVTKRGKRKRFGSTMQWPVGTWSLKAEFYGNLHKAGLAAGEACDPPGYCHFHNELGQEYFQQITAEYYVRAIVRGKLHEEWRPRRPDNHWLDCRVYAMAMAEHLGLSRMSPAEWAALREKYEGEAAADLFSPAPVAVAQKEKSATPPSTEAPAAKPKKENRWRNRKL